MPIITVERARKVFRVTRKRPGLAGALQALFRPAFDEVVAVDDVGFTVEPGEMVGYIGVNGAGKSTTIKMLTGITRSVFEMHEFAKFPLSIYPRSIGILLTWLVPYGFASFYPASHLLGRDVGALAWLGPPVAALLLLLAYRVWNLGLRHYASTGS